MRVGVPTVSSLVAVAGVVWMIAGVSGVSADDLTEENMTQRDYAKITAVAPDGPTETLEETPTPVHDISENVEKFIANPAAGAPPLGKKVVKGNDWKAETPEQRNAHLRSIRETAPPGSWLVISVPDGDVWLFFDAEPPSNNHVFLSTYVFRVWQEWERAELPPTVPREKKVSQSDRHGTPPDRAVAVSEEP
jgi:hypothetical protein